MLKVAMYLLLKVINQLLSSQGPGLMIAKDDKNNAASDNHSCSYHYTPVCLQIRYTHVSLELATLDLDAKWCRQSNIINTEPLTTSNFMNIA